MKIFLDSVDLIEIEKYISYGTIDGITTNPSLFGKISGNVSFYEFAKQICLLAKNLDVSVEAPSTKYEDMIEECKKLIGISSNLVLKLPMTWEGVRACRYFANSGQKVNMTLCFSVNQAIIAAKAGATYISPFVGRLDDIGQSGMKLIADIKKVYDHYAISTQILAASIRSVENVTQVSLIGADVVTVPVSVMSQMLDHELTQKGLKLFSEDWAKSKMII